VSMGGRFDSAPSTPSGASSYIGGEVRLVNLPEGCTFIELVATLAKAERTSNYISGSASSSGRQEGPSAAFGAIAALLAAQQMGGVMKCSSVTALAPSYCTVRYQLPSDPDVMVDVLDDEDVRLMFEESAEIRAREGAH